MTIQDLIQLAAARAAHLSQQYAAHESLGDVAAMARVETEIAQTQQTLEALQALV
jgi:hypothetical protein